MRSLLVFNLLTLSLQTSSTVWRLRKAETVQTMWRVYELEFHSDPACAGDILEPEPSTNVIASQNFQAPDNVFDGDVTTAGTSGFCSISCFVGRTFPPPTIVRCVRLFQDPNRSLSAFTVFLEYSTAYPKGVFVSTGSFSYLAGGLWLQLDNLWATPGFRTRWRIANTAVVRAGWRIMEFRLFSDTTCEEPLPHDTPLSSDYSGINDPLSAIDGDLTTSWASICPLGGCPAYSAWIGLHLPRDFPTVSCMKVFQSPNPNELTTSLVVQFWDGITSWTPFRSFMDLAGGIELFLSGLLYKSAWRVSNALATTDAVKINEVRFFSDPQCTAKIIRDIELFTDPRFKGLSSPRSSASSDLSFVFDGNFGPPTWISACTSCNPNEVYVGIQGVDGDAREIACVNVYMEPGASVRELQVQYIGMIKWEVLYNVVYASGGYWLSFTSRSSNLILPSRIYPLYDLPMYRVRVVGSWSTVRSIAFYPNAECRGSPTPGSPLASVGVPGAEPVFPLEGNGAWTPVGNDAWIGVVVLDKTISVGCVQLIEDTHRKGESKLIILEQLNQWPAETFTTMQTFLYDDPAGSGTTFLQIGFEGETLWRLRRADAFAGIPSGANWRVSELQWFASPDCGGSPSNGLLLGSSVLTVSKTDLAASTDGDLATHWQPSSSDFQPWLGVSFGRDPVAVSCVRLYQPVEAVFSSRVVNLETSDGLSRSWVLNRQINFVSGGMWLSLTSQFAHPAPGTLWRVVNIAPMGKRLYWQTRNLRFFKDVGCKEEIFQINDGVPVASGYSGTNAPLFSSGSYVTEHWSAQCDYCSSYQAWIGFLLPDDAPLEIEPGCVEVTTNVGLDILKWEVEKFTGQDDSACTSDPNLRTCWTPLITTTRKACVYTDDGITDLTCSEMVFVKTTPRPSTVYVESESAVLVMAAYVAPVAVVLALVIFCCALLSSPKEDKKPISQLFVYPTYLWFLFWIGVIIVLVLLSFWLLSMLLLAVAASFVLFGSLLAPIILFERNRAKQYVYTAEPHKPTTRAYLGVIFAVQQMGICVFDACLFRVTAAYLEIVNIENFVSFLVPVAKVLNKMTDFTSPNSFRCGGSSLIFAAMTTFVAISVFFACGTYDALAAAECTNIAALLSRNRRVYALVSLLSGVFVAVLHVVSLTSAGALFNGFSDSSQSSSGCRKEFAADQDPVALHAPMAVYTFGTLSLWVVTILAVVPVVVSFLSGHFFPSGVDPRVARMLGVPELGATEKKVDEFVASTVEAEAATRVGKTGSKRRITQDATKNDTSEMDAIFSLIAEVYKNIFSSIPMLIGRAVPAPFRISERAKLHSTAFQLPNPPLLALQRASVRMVSLIWQCIPVGIFVGKLADYFALPPVRTAVVRTSDFHRSAMVMQGAGGLMYLCVVISGAFMSDSLVALLFLVIAVLIGIFRGYQMALWVTMYPEPSLAPGNSEEIDMAVDLAVPVIGNSVVSLRTQPSQVRSVGQRTIRFLGDN